MLADGRRTDQSPMFGHHGRIPALDAVALRRPSALSTLRAGWLPRHTLALLLLSPLLFLGYLASAGDSASPIGDGRPAGEVEIISWIDDHSRYALHVSAHRRITAPVVADSFEQAAGKHQYPASTLTDNGMVYTVRLAGQGRRGGRTKLESELRRLGITQKNGKPNHPQTQGKVERFQQTLKKWLVAQPHQPATITALQQLLDDFVDEYNHRRPHRALPHQATPATIYATGPKATPPTDPSSQAHDRVRTDRIDKTGAVTLRVHGKLRHIGVGRTHARTPVKLLVHDLDVTIIHAATGEILRELAINPDKDYQPLTTPPQRKN